jgi:hypothetical protein
VATRVLISLIPFAYYWGAKSVGPHAEQMIAQAIATSVGRIGARMTRDPALVAYGRGEWDPDRGPARTQRGTCAPEPS